MELSGDTLESAVRGLRPEASNRKSPRMPMRLRLRIVPFANGALGTPLAIWTRDISTSGIGIMSSKPLAPGIKFVLRLPRKNEPALFLMCVVRNCQRADDVFMIGASFTEVAPLDHATPAPGGSPAAPESGPSRDASAPLHNASDPPRDASVPPRNPSDPPRDASSPSPDASDSPRDTPHELTEEIRRLSESLLAPAPAPKSA